MGMFEDLSDEVSTLRTALERLCRKVGHEFTDGAYPKCSQHYHTKSADTGTSCDICGAFKCCEAVL